MKKVNYKNWKQSYEKWKEIVKRTKKEIPFDDDYGWNDLVVQGGACGYCKTFECGCLKCSLSKKYCFEDGMDGKGSYFWIYMDSVNDECYRFALGYAKKILAKIKRDGIEWGHWDKYKGR